MKFVKKPVEIVAHRIGDNGWPDEIWEGVMNNKIILHMDKTPPYVEITTLEGVMIGNNGDWIIRGIKGEFYPCKPDIFSATHAPAALTEPAQPAPSLSFEDRWLPLNTEKGE